MQLPDTTVRIQIRHELPACAAFAHNDVQPLSPWTRSRAKRLFDISMVVAFSPVILPLLLVMALAVRLTSRGPVIFRQTRVGSFGSTFTLFKFRTMIDTGVPRRGIATAAGDAQITPLGRLLRWMKLDELPQVVNVLRGEMSLVGPRPRVHEQQLGIFTCRPGLTSPATLAFAREDRLLASIPAHLAAEFYMKTLLPEKHRLDREYMARATCFSDLLLLVRTLFRRWDSLAVVRHDGRQDSPEPEWASAAANPNAGVFDN